MRQFSPNFLKSVLIIVLIRPFSDKNY